VGRKSLVRDWLKRKFAGTDCQLVTMKDDCSASQLRNFYCPNADWFVYDRFSRMLEFRYIYIGRHAI
jgi:hypothetical protein